MDSLDTIRKKVLDDIESAEKKAKQFLFLNAATEVVLGGTYLLVMDFHDRLHWLILIAAMLIYTNLFIQQISLASKMKAGNLRILKALQILKAPTNNEIDS